MPSEQHVLAVFVIASLVDQRSCGMFHKLYWFEQMFWDYERMMSAELQDNTALA